MSLQEGTYQKTPLVRVRRSLQDLQTEYDLGNRVPLETLVRAFQGMQKLSPSNPDSFFAIASFHGEPFTKPEWEGQYDPKEYWGGWCTHANVLFPTWHRAYLLRFEQAMRRISGCETVTLPFWDTCLDADSDAPIPWILTALTFMLDGHIINNPLHSYTLPQDLCNVAGQETRHTKPAGYTTVRYPQAGLVGCEEDRQKSIQHNVMYSDHTGNVAILNRNLRNWLTGRVKIPPAPGDAETPFADTYSLVARYQQCLDAPNYTVFSNTESQRRWCSDYGLGDKHYAVSLESPHNGVHLALGGHYEKGKDGMNASPILGASGDMGEANTASMDPIFFFHHCFIDYCFWKWQQKQRRTARGNLSVIKGYPGTSSSDGEAKFTRSMPPNTPLTTQTPLRPFKKADRSWYTSDDVTDIEKDLHYTYGSGSLDPLVECRDLAAPDPEVLSPELIIRAYNINRTNYPGSFVVRIYAKLPSGEKLEIGREPIFSRWALDGCVNCQSSLPVTAHAAVTTALARRLRALGVDTGKDYLVEVQARHEMNFGTRECNRELAPKFEVLRRRHRKVATKTWNVTVNTYRQSRL